MAVSLQDSTVTTSGPGMVVRGSANPASGVFFRPHTINPGVHGNAKLTSLKAIEVADIEFEYVAPRPLERCTLAVSRIIEPLRDMILGWMR